MRPCMVPPHRSSIMSSSWGSIWDDGTAAMSALALSKSSCSRGSSRPQWETLLIDCALDQALGEVFAVPEVPPVPSLV